MSQRQDGQSTGCVIYTYTLFIRGLPRARIVTRPHSFRERSRRPEMEQKWSQNETEITVFFLFLKGILQYCENTTQCGHGAQMGCLLFSHSLNVSHSPAWGHLLTYLYTLLPTLNRLWLVCPRVLRRLHRRCPRRSSGYRLDNVLSAWVGCIRMKAIQLPRPLTIRLTVIATS